MAYFWALLISGLVSIYLACSPQKIGEPAAMKDPLPPRASGPCAIALATQSGQEALDREILQQQEAARTAENPTVYLHRLGWSFVAKARKSFDPGYYTLAQASAQCMAVYEPNNLDGHLLKGHVLHQLHHFAQAQAIAQELTRSRGLPHDFLLLGDTLVEQGDLPGAAKAYQTAMDQRPGPQVFGRVAHLREAVGDLDGAIAMAQASLRAAGPRDHEAAAWSRVQLAHLLVQSNNITQARIELEKALQAEADYPPALSARAKLACDQGDFPSAIADLRRAIARYPHPESLWLLAEALRAQGDVEAAIVIENTLRQNGPQEDPRTTALYLATSQQDLQRASELAEAELAARHDGKTLDVAAWASFANGNFERARALSQEALATGIQDARIFLHAALIQAQTGDKDAVGHLLAQADRMSAALYPSEKTMLSHHRASLARP